MGCGCGGKRNIDPVSTEQAIQEAQARADESRRLRGAMEQASAENALANASSGNNVSR